MPRGTHICQIYTDEKERDSSLNKFLLRGIQDKELNACFTENVTREALTAFFKENGVSLEENIQSGALIMEGAHAVYFRDNQFNPERMLKLLTEFHESSTTNGYTGARVIGEMSADIHHIQGGSRLLEYESRVSIMLRNHPVTTVCQYDARAFDGATILQVLKVHPMMIVRGAVVQNPFFIPPEEFLQETMPHE